MDTRPSSPIFRTGLGTRLRPVHSKITLTYSLTWPLYTPENDFQGAIKGQGGHFLGFAQVFSALIVRKNCQNGLYLKTATCTVDYRSTTCVGTSTIRLRSIKSSLPCSLPLRHSRDKLFQALYRLQATESWAGPGNEANPYIWRTTVRHDM